MYKQSKQQGRVSSMALETLEGVHADRHGAYRKSLNIEQGVKITHSKQERRSSLLISEHRQSPIPTY